MHRGLGEEFALENKAVPGADVLEGVDELVLRSKQKLLQVSALVHLL